MKLTPLKRLQKECKSSPAVSSPGGPFSVRTSSFQLIGFAHLNINTLTRNAWTLEKVPFNSPMNGHLLMRVSVAMEGGVSEKSFLTMFDDVGGFGAWNRRWCVLNGAHISYWSYPDHENSKVSPLCVWGGDGGISRANRSLNKHFIDWLNSYFIGKFRMPRLANVYDEEGGAGVSRCLRQAVYLSAYLCKTFESGGSIRPYSRSQGQHFHNEVRVLGFY